MRVKEYTAPLLSTSKVSLRFTQPWNLHDNCMLVQKSTSRTQSLSVLLPSKSVVFPSGQTMQSVLFSFPVLLTYLVATRTGAVGSDSARSSPGASEVRRIHKVCRLLTLPGLMRLLKLRQSTEMETHHFARSRYAPSHLWEHSSCRDRA